jgi:predicted transcriptional regulator
MPETIFLPKWTELLVALYNAPQEQCYTGRLHRKTGMTIRHIRNLTVLLEERGMISKMGDGKIRYITLTEQGKQLAELFRKIYPQMKR